MSIHDLSARIDEHLREFQAIDLREESSSDCCLSPVRAYFPSLYLSGKKDKGLMNLPTVGKAMIDYKVRRRHVDEGRDDGVPRYGADIEIQSIEHVEMPEVDDDDDDEAELSRPLSITEFAGFYPVRNSGRIPRKTVSIGGLPQGQVPGMGFKGKGITDTIKFGPSRPSTPESLRVHRAKTPEQVVEQGRRINRKVTDEMIRINRGDSAKGATYDRAKSMKKRRDVGLLAATGKLMNRLEEHLRHFAGERERDPAGRFAAGNVPSPQDYAIAAEARKKKAAAAGAAGLATAGALATRPGRAAAASIGSGMVRAAGRILR